MTEPLTAAVIVCLFSSEVIIEGGKALTKGVTDTFAQLVNTIREKFKTEGTSGLLKRAENDLQVNSKLTVQKIFENVGDLGVNNLSEIPKLTGFPQNIPSSNTDKFIGRERELERLHQQLQRNDEVVITAVEGMGGVGKTELAIQYSLLHLQLHTFPGGICWLRAREEEDIGLQIIEFARTDLGLQPPEDLELLERIRWCWKRWHQGNTLMVVDDVKDYSQIKPLLPPQPSQFKVVITTRLKLDDRGSLFLEVLQSEDALKLLTELVGKQKVTQESLKAKELVQRLGYLPLGLQLVGRYVKKRKISLTEMLRRLEEKGLGHPSLEVKENDPTWTDNIERGVAAAFELSWSELSEFAQELGCLLSLFANAPIPWSVVEGAAEKDVEELEDAKVELENLHLLVSEDTYLLHQLIREFLKNKQKNLASGDSQKYSFCQAMVEVAKEIPQTPNQNQITILTHAIPHLAEVAQNLTDVVSDKNLIWVFTGLGWFYQGQGLYALALPWLEQCVSQVQSRLGEEHPDVATSYTNLALLYKNQGRYSEAEPLLKKALELSQRLLTEEHPDVATSYTNLALLYKNQGRYNEAEPLLKKALELSQRLLTEEHPDVASSYNNLALLYKNQGRYSEAEPLLKKALELSQRLLTEEHPDVASSYNNLALLYKNQGRYSEAEPLLKKALELSQRLLTEEHPDVASSYTNLALLYKNQGRYSEAEPLLKKALELSQRLLTEEHPDVASSYTNLALLYKNQGRYSEAEPLLKKALELSQRLLTEKHPDVAVSYNNLAGFYYDQSRYSEAEPLLKKALEIAELSLGVEHPSTTTIRKNLKSLHDIHP